MVNKKGLQFMYQILLAFILYCIATVIGIHTTREWNSYHIICPLNETGEQLIQAMSDGQEVLCIYTKTPMKKGRSSYKSGALQSAYPY